MAWEEKRTMRMLVISAVSVIALGAPVAEALPGSDRLLIERIDTGQVLYDHTISGSPPDTRMSYLEVHPPPEGFYGMRVVLLTRPPGEPYGDNPVFVPGTNLVVSDVVSFSVLWSGGSYLFESYYFDDDDPLFLADINEYAIPLEKTGELQDLTSLLGSNYVGWRISVQSTVIPEPGTGLLALTGLLGLARWRTRLHAPR
jgi:hypothetical protein